MDGNRPAGLARDMPATRDDTGLRAPARIDVSRPRDDEPPPPVRRVRSWIVPVIATLFVVAVAIPLGIVAWNEYYGLPWTRDGAVRVYTVGLAPEVSGRVVALPVVDNQFVHKGDVIMTIDPRDYAIAVEQAQAQVQQALVDMNNKDAEATRRQSLTQLSTSLEEQQSYNTQAQAARATYQQQLSMLAKAKLDLTRTQVHSPVNGWVTNLQAQVGDYATTGTRALTLVNADSFWVDGYFEETNLPEIDVGAPAKIKLLGVGPLIDGHVQGVSRGISVSNASAGQGGLADVNPVFTWIQLAQRIPVRIAIDHVPAGLLLAAGQTASVQIEPLPPGQHGVPVNQAPPVTDPAPGTTADPPSGDAPNPASPPSAAPSR